MNVKKAKRLYKAAKAEADRLRYQVEKLKGKVLPKLFELSRERDHLKWHLEAAREQITKAHAIREEDLKECAARIAERMEERDRFRVELEETKDLLAKKTVQLGRVQTAYDEACKKLQRERDEVVRLKHVVDEAIAMANRVCGERDRLKEAAKAPLPLPKTIHNTHPIITGSGKVSPFYVAREPLKGGAAGGQGQGRAVRTFDGHDAYCPKAQNNDLEAECICRRTVDPTD